MAKLYWMRTRRGFLGGWGPLPGPWILRVCEPDGGKGALLGPLVSMVQGFEKFRWNLGGNPCLSCSGSLGIQPFNFKRPGWSAKIPGKKQLDDCCCPHPAPVGARWKHVKPNCACLFFAAPFLVAFPCGFLLALWEILAYATARLPFLQRHVAWQL